MSTLPTPQARHIFFLHTAIRLATSTLISALRDLDALAPDAHLHDLDSRLHRLSHIVLSHCRIEDTIVLPALSAAAAKVPVAPHDPPPAKAPLSPHRFIPSDSQERPAKRPRGPSWDPRYSPVSIHLHDAENDHAELHAVFRTLRASLMRLRAAPVFVDDALVFTAPQPNLQGGTVGDTAPVSRKQALGAVRDDALRMKKILHAHMDSEEELIQPAFDHYLSPLEQGELLVRCMQATVVVPNVSDAFRLVPEHDLIALFAALVPYATTENFQSIAATIADVLSTDQWTRLCDSVPQLKCVVMPSHNPLIQIYHLHKALERDLNDIVVYSESIDLKDQKQVQSLSTRFAFLRRVYSCHADGEDNVLLKELHLKLRSLPCFSEAAGFCDDHVDEEALFEDFASRLARFQEDLSLNADGSRPGALARQELTASLKRIANHLIPHMRDEEAKWLPLLQKHFSVKDQDRMVQRVMSRVPADFLQELIPWMFGYLSVDDQESMLRNLVRSAPSDEICKVVGALAESVQKGMTDRMEWNELCLRVPEIEAGYKAVVDQGSEPNAGPVSEILRVHKAFRIELHALLRRAKAVLPDGSMPNPRALVSLAESVAFLRKMVGDHSQAEDDILLPRLEERVPGISAKYKDDHSDERELFRNLAKCLEELQCAGEEPECVRLVQRLHYLSRVLRDEMVAHLKQEEEQMWPHVTKHFSAEEQSEMVALIFGQMPGSRLRELLPWMIRMLSVSERNTMMNHILQVTRSTMFETWLKTWLPLDENDMDHDKRVSSQARGGSATSSNVSGALGDASPETPPAASTALVLLKGRENIERTIRSIARDSSLSVEDRTMMMQQVMLAPYNEVRASARAAHANNVDDKDDLSPTYATDKHGVSRLGCKHYLRACKIRAACCNRLYTCRLCHDDAEQGHIMDRTLTTQVCCMRCGTLQPVAASCINESCRKSFARYFCEICVFYDDEERSIYHCHSCNVCRVGKGLGQDFFHCMKCNQCMSMKYQHKGHVCIEKAMESDCPVCHQYLFTSTSPVKYLRCGHLMHMSCFKAYGARCISCPICAKSLEEMTPLFQQLDRQLSGSGQNSMPYEYRAARCDIFCLDCHRTSNTAYHFVYNKCPNCNSYNTRIDRLLANGSDAHLIDRT